MIKKKMAAATTGRRGYGPVGHQSMIPVLLRVQRELDIDNNRCVSIEQHRWMYLLYFAGKYQGYSSSFPTRPIN